MSDTRKVFKKFNSFAAADEEDKRYYRALSPAQRINILLALIIQHQQSDEPTKGFARVYRVIKLA